MEIFSHFQQCLNLPKNSCTRENVWSFSQISRKRIRYIIHEGSTVYYIVRSCIFHLRVKLSDEGGRFFARSLYAIRHSFVRITTYLYSRATSVLLLLVFRERATDRRLPSDGDGYVARRPQEAPLSPTSAFNRRDSTVCYTSCRPIVVTTSSSSPVSPPRACFVAAVLLPFISRGEKPHPCFAESLRPGGRDEEGRKRGRKKKYSRRDAAPIPGNKRACRDKRPIVLIKRYGESGDLRQLESRDESESTRSSRISSIETRRFRKTKGYSVPKNRFSKISESWKRIDTHI